MTFPMAMKFPIKSLLMLVSVALLSGCVIAVNTDDWEDSDNWYARQHKIEKKIERLELGRSEMSIRDEFGSPDFNEAFIRNGSEFVVLYYRSRHVESDGITTKSETTPLVFVEGNLVGWGESALENATGN